jgi:ATP/maltotriose-dependent transcriptional regulator MalT
MSMAGQGSGALDDPTSTGRRFTQVDPRAERIYDRGMSRVVDEQREADGATVIVATKLARPPVRAGHLARERLLAAMQSGATRRLTLLAAPPGFGKTTLLSAWAANDEGVAWLWLDAGDNDPVRFFTYVIEAIQRVRPGIGLTARAALRAPRAALTEVVLPLLVNDLAAPDTGVVTLVLDDYHVISDPAVHDALGYLLERTPPSLRIVIASREDPPLPLPRLRARDELCELRATDLRFTADEARVFLAGALDVALSDADAERLRERTNGWPAAMHLATLSLRSAGDARAFVDGFSGDDRHVVDYLTSEILAGLDPERRAFLTQTSILDRLTAPLCDAVRGREDSAAIMRALESSQLLMPLDTRREWYRYQPLLADVLRQEARTQATPQQSAAHARASAWYRGHGLIVDAARHAHAAGDTVAAVDLLGRYWPLFFEQGQLATVAGWIDALPRGALADDWSLCLAAATVTTHLRRLDEAHSWLNTARAAPPLPRDGERPDGPLASQEASLTLLRGDMPATVDAARRAIAAVSGHQTGWSVIARVALGAALWWSDDPTEARAVFERARAGAQEAGSTLGEVCALAFHAAIDLEDGDAEAAVTAAEAAAKLTADRELIGFPFTALAPMVLGKTLARRGDHTGAIALIEPALDLAQREDSWVIRTYGLLALAEAQQRRGDPPAARRAITRARELLSALPDPGAAPAYVERTERLLKLTPRARRDQARGEFWELSERELEVLRLLASSLSQREIAGELFVSFSTVKSHVRSIFRKLGVDARDDAVTRARELGLL